MDPLSADDPREIGEYRLEGRLGTGGMGRVYLGRSPGGRPVAVKVVRPELAGDQGFRRRFAREAEAAQKVNAFYTAPVIDADTEADPPWLVTAYVPGPSLRTAIDESGPLPPAEITALGAGLAEGLLAIHRKGIVHRDLTPGNVILAGDGPRIVDFGIARALDATSPATTTGIIGTVAFMSPEQAKGAETGPAGDVFALACVLTYAATGRSPFGTGAPEAVLFRVVHGEPDLDGVPGELKDLLTACLDKDPKRRPETAQVLGRLTRSREDVSAGDASTAFTAGDTRGFDAEATEAVGTGAVGTEVEATRAEATRAEATEAVRPTRVEASPRATRVQATAPFTLTRQAVRNRAGIRHLCTAAALGLAIGIITYVVATAIDELPLPESDNLANLAIFLVGAPTAGAVFGMLVDPVSPALARYRFAGAVYGLVVVFGLPFALLAGADGLADTVPEEVAGFILVPCLVLGPLFGGLAGNARGRDRLGGNASARPMSWYAHRDAGAVLGLALAGGVLTLADETGALTGREPAYTTTVVLTLAGLTVLGALLGMLAEATTVWRARTELTVDLDGLSRAWPDRGTSFSVSWSDLDRVELLDGRVVGWFTDTPEIAAWADRNRLPLHAVEDSRGPVAPLVAYVVFDSGLQRGRPGEAGSLHRLDEALRAFGAGRYR